MDFVLHVSFFLILLKFTSVHLYFKKINKKQKKSFLYFFLNGGIVGWSALYLTGVLTFTLGTVVPQGNRGYRPISTKYALKRDK